MAQQVSTNTFGCAKWIVSSDATQGTHTTIGGALTSSSSGDTIFIRPGSYTENLTLKAGVNLSAFMGDGDTPNVTIIGNATFTAAGTVSIGNVRLQTNSAALLTVSGSVASIVNLNNCYINCSNNTGITFSTSSASGQVSLFDCKGDVGTTGIGLFAHSSAGTLNINNCVFSNSGGSSTASTASAGVLQIDFCRLFNPITTSGTNAFGMNNSTMNTSAQNATSLTVGGSGNGSMNHSNLASGSASTISIGASLNIAEIAVNSSNTNAITGAGTILYSGIAFTGTSTTINTTTQTTAGTLQGSKNTAPTAGMIGEQISNSATSIATTTTTPKSITSITLTAGVWDVSAISFANAGGGTALMQAHVLSISPTDNTLTGSPGVQEFQLLAVQAAMGGVVPQFRVVVTTSTTYYAVVQNNYTSTTCATNARITATRVG